MKRLVIPALLTAAVVAGCGGTSSTNASSSGGAYSSHAAKPTSTPAGTTSSAALVKTADGSLGKFLVDSQGRTLYLWVADKGSTSNCSGGCAAAWPPLTTTGKPQAGTGAKAALLGTTKRADGTTEVTYAGHPLYHFAGDTAPGQTTGQGNEGFGAYWWVVAPDGKAIESGGS